MKKECEYTKSKTKMIKFDTTCDLKPDVAVAVSMGVDSVSAAYFLSRKRYVHLIHVNHGTAMADYYESKFIKFVEYLRTNSDKVSWSVKSAEKLKGDKPSEQYLREIRYNLLDEEMSCILNNVNYIDQLVVCHHLNDCVESYLMNCFNGNPDYSPIPKITIRGQHKGTRNGYSVIRPFLKTEKANFIAYANKHNLNEFVVEDSTNYDISYTRNWLRNELIPQIEVRYPGIKTVVRKKIK